MSFRIVDRQEMLMTALPAAFRFEETKFVFCYLDQQQTKILELRLL
jgi:hypothetical protein